MKTFGSAVYGVEAITINIEVHVSQGSKTYVVGLPDNAVKESIQRIEGAVHAVKLMWYLSRCFAIECCAHDCYAFGTPAKVL